MHFFSNDFKVIVYLSFILKTSELVSASYISKNFSLNLAKPENSFISLINVYYVIT